MKKTHCLIAFGFLLIFSSIMGISFARIDHRTAVEQEINRQLKLHPELKILNPLLVSATSNSLFIGDSYHSWNPFASAGYNTSSKRVMISEGINTFQIGSALAHEYGHFLFREKINILEKETWIRLVREDGLSPSRYGLGETCTTWSCQYNESFAEWWSIIAMGHTEGAFANAEKLLQSSRQYFFIQEIKDKYFPHS